MIVVWLFLAMPWVCLQFVIVVFPDHTHLLSYMEQRPMDKNEFYYFSSKTYGYSKEPSH